MEFSGSLEYSVDKRHFTFHDDVDKTLVFHAVTVTILIALNKLIISLMQIYIGCRLLFRSLNCVFFR